MKSKIFSAALIAMLATSAWADPSPANLSRQFKWLEKSPRVAARVSSSLDEFARIAHHPYWDASQKQTTLLAMLDEMEHETDAALNTFSSIRKQMGKSTIDAAHVDFTHARTLVIQRRFTTAAALTFRWMDAITSYLPRGEKKN